MSGPISDGEYLMSTMWISHSIFPARTLLKQQGIVVLSKSVFKISPMTFIFILGKERLSPVAEYSYSQLQYPAYPTMYRSNYWEFHLGIKISQELGIILIFMGGSQNMLLSEEKEKSVVYTLKYLRIGVQVPTQSFIPFDS